MLNTWVSLSIAHLAGKLVDNLSKNISRSIGFVYKIRNFVNCDIMTTWFTPTSNIHNYATQSCTTSDHTWANRVIPNNNLFVPYAMTSYYGLRSLKIGGTKIWNNLPSSHNCFKKGHFNHLMSFYNPTI